MPIRFHWQESAQSLFVTTGRAWKLQSGFGLWIICLHLQKLELFFVFVFFTAAIVARRDKRKGRTHSLQLCIQDIRAEPWQSTTTEKEKPGDVKLWRVQGCLFIFPTPLQQPWLIEENTFRQCWHSSMCPLHSTLADRGATFKNTGVANCDPRALFTDHRRSSSRVKNKTHYKYNVRQFRI